MIARVFKILGLVLFFGLSAELQAESSRNIDLEDSDAMLAPQVKLPLILELKAKVEVSDMRVVLDDIAICSGSRLFCDEAYGVELGASPRAGKSLYLSRKKIEKVIYEEWPQVKLQFKGADSVRVKTIATKIDSNEILEALNSEIEKKTSHHKNVRVVVDSIQVPQNLKFIGQNYELSFPNLFSAQMPSLDFLVGKLNGSKMITGHYHIVDASEVSDQKFRFLARMRVEVMLPVATRNLKRSTRIRKTDFSKEWVTVKKTGDLVTNIDLRIGYRLKQSIGVGRPVRTSAIELPNSVERGQILSLFVQKGGLKIKTKAKALKNGAIGQEIDVISIKTGKRSRARIVSKESARLL